MGTGGHLTGASPQTVNYGADGATVTAVADTGYHFVKWSDDVLSASRTDTDITADLTVSATFAHDTFTLDYAAGANGHLTGVTHQTDVVYGTDGTAVTAVADTGYHFVKWSDDVTDNPRTDTSVMADVDVSAEFAINTYTLTYNVGTGGHLTGASPQTVNYGADGATVTAVADTGYHFVKWSDDVLSASRTDTDITADLTVSATFAHDTFTLDYAAGANGHLTGVTHQTDVVYGTDGTAVTAVADTGYHFVKWSDDVTDNPRTDTSVMADVDVTAQFAINTYTLTYNVGTGGHLTGASPQTVNYGADGATVTAVADTGYHFVKWSDDVLSASRTDTDITADLTVSATFAHDTFTLDYAAGANGHLTGVTHQTDVVYGTDGTAVTAVADTGYHFVKWSDDVTDNPRTDTSVMADVDVSAQFAINTYTLTYNVGTGGHLTGASPQTVNYGADGATVTAVADTGYHFVKWSDDVLSASRTDTDITADLTVSATFAHRHLHPGLRRRRQRAPDRGHPSDRRGLWHRRHRGHRGSRHRVSLREVVR